MIKIMYNISAMAYVERDFFSYFALFLKVIKGISMKLTLWHGIQLAFF